MRLSSQRLRATLLPLLLAPLVGLAAEDPRPEASSLAVETPSAADLETTDQAPDAIRQIEPEAASAEPETASAEPATAGAKSAVGATAARAEPQEDQDSSHRALPDSPPEAAEPGAPVEAAAPIAAETPSADSLDGPIIGPAGTEDPSTEAAASTDEAALDAAPGDTQPPADTLILLGVEVPRGTSTRLAWSPSESFSGISVPTPVLVVNGSKPGPTVCLTAAVHGDELTGIEIVRRVMFGLNPTKLTGTVIGVPIVNLQGFRSNTRYLPDRRDLNRYFPGSAKGSLAERVAHSFFHEVITHCNAVVDMHTGSFHRTNLPQVRADMNVPGVAELARNMGDIMVLQSNGNLGTLRRAAVESGIPAVVLEAGEPMRLAEEEVAHGVKSVQSLLNGMGMHGSISRWGQREPVYYQSFWVRANKGGILFSRVKLGDRVKAEQLLGTVTDPITNARAELRSPRAGRVIGMALNQVVMPGFAAYHIGIQTTEQHAAEPVQGVEEDEAGEAEQQPGTSTAPAASPANQPANGPAAEAREATVDDRLEDA